MKQEVMGRREKTGCGLQVPETGSVRGSGHCGDCWAVSRAHLRLCLCLAAWMQVWSRGELEMTRMGIFPDN